MDSWSALPEMPLRLPGELCDAFGALGCATYREAAAHLHVLPYGRNTRRDDWRLVLAEERGTCSTKHALLAALAAEQAIPLEVVSLTVGIYDMCEANTPGVGRVLAAHGLESLPEAHCYLRSGRARVDVTRSGVEADADIERFHHEWAIDPAQIGDHKVGLHRGYLREWLGAGGAPDLDLQSLWRIREACIAALGAQAQT